jgi:hypothetical protein
MNTIRRIETDPSKVLWHVTVDLAYEGGENDSGKDGVEKVLSSLKPLFENDNEIRHVIIMRLPEKA